MSLTTETAAPVAHLAPAAAVVHDFLGKHVPDAQLAVQAVVRTASLAAASLAIRPVAVAPVQLNNGWRIDTIVTRLDDARLSGDTLLSLPDTHECLILNFTGTLHLPSYVAEKLRADEAEPRVLAVAAFATILDALITP